MQKPSSHATQSQIDNAKKNLANAQAKLNNDEKALAQLTDNTETQPSANVVTTSSIGSQYVLRSSRPTVSSASSVETNTPAYVSTVVTPSMSSAKSVESSTSKSSQAKMPQMGEHGNSSMLALIGASVLSMLGLAGLDMKKNK